MNPLYEEDFNEWIEKQINLLKTKEFDSLDTENLIEEIEGMSRSDKRALKSQMIRLLKHLLKFKHQPQKQEDSSSWFKSINESKDQIEMILEDSPSLKPLLESYFVLAYAKARSEAATETGLPIELFSVDCPWSIQEVLGE
jgi:hypothetical protein